MTLWTVALQAPLSMELLRQEYWNRLPFPILRDLSDLGIEPTSLASLALAGGFFATGVTWEVQAVSTYTIKDCFSSIGTGHKSCNP